MSTINPHKFAGVYTSVDGEYTSLSTKSLVPGVSVYGEKLIKIGSDEYRIWSPRRSKLAAALRKGLTEMPIQPGSKMLYLGAASGTTVSHCSDIVGQEGVIYAVEFAHRSARDLVKLAAMRPNVIPIIEDARHPTRYASLVSGTIEVIYQDVAQPNQAGILIENLKTFCSFGAWGLLAIKARSIDSTTSLDKVYNKEISELANRGVEIIENIDLEPLEKDHRFIVCRVTEDIT
jgi:fibrillarin-like rRNA methylase